MPKLIMLLPNFGRTGNAGMLAGFSAMPRCYGHRSSGRSVPILLFGQPRRDRSSVARCPVYSPIRPRLSTCSVPLVLPSAIFFTVRHCFLALTSNNRRCAVESNEKGWKLVEGIKFEGKKPQSAGRPLPPRK